MIIEMSTTNDSTPIMTYKRSVFVVDDGGDVTLILTNVVTLVADKLAVPTFVVIVVASDEDDDDDARSGVCVGVCNIVVVVVGAVTVAGVVVSGVGVVSVAAVGVVNVWVIICVVVVAGAVVAVIGGGLSHATQFTIVGNRPLGMPTNKDSSILCTIEAHLRTSTTKSKHYSCES
jgi:hypothetical protein